MLSSGRMGLWQAGQWDAGRTMLSPAAAGRCRRSGSSRGAPPASRPAGQATMGGRAMRHAASPSATAASPLERARQHLRPPAAIAERGKTLRRQQALDVGARHATRPRRRPREPGVSSAWKRSNTRIALATASVSRSAGRGPGAATPERRAHEADGVDPRLHAGTWAGAGPA